MTFQSSKARVLLVEDFDDLANLVSSLLIQSGFEVFVAQTVSAACSLARSATPDVLLSHGFYAGHETCFDLRAALRESGWDGPAILVSGKLLDDMLVRQCEDAGFSQVLQKPASCVELLDAVCKAVGISTEASCDGEERHR